MSSSALSPPAANASTGRPIKNRARTARIRVPRPKAIAGSPWEGVGTVEIALPSWPDYDALGTMTKQPNSAAESLANAIASGDRRALARAITLVESTKPADQAQAEALLGALLPYSGKSLRLGISGAPGAGKSTFIEAFGKFLTGQRHKVAGAGDRPVLAAFGRFDPRR